MSWAPYYVSRSHFRNAVDDSLSGFIKPFDDLKKNDIAGFHVDLLRIVRILQVLGCKSQAKIRALRSSLIIH